MMNVVLINPQMLFKGICVLFADDEMTCGCGYVPDVFVHEANWPDRLLLPMVQTAFSDK